MRVLVKSSILLLVALAPAAHAEGIRVTRPNLVTGELGGRSIIYSINYERYVNNRAGIGVGLEGFGTSEGGVFMIPLYVSVNPVGDIHSLYLAGGANWVAGATNWDEIEGIWLGTGSVGYQYQAEGGFVVRPTINIVYRGDGFLVLPGIALGGSF